MQRQQQQHLTKIVVHVNEVHFASAKMTPQCQIFTILMPL